MYTAIIADDENKICQLILKLCDWEKLGIEVIEICNHGKSTIEAIEKNNPDICITDIKMPIYDGIQIISKAKEMKVDTAFIIISGYRHFEYAHSAVKLGAIDYLLKPIDKAQLNAVLAKACHSIDERRAQKSQMQEYRAIVQDRSKYLKEQFWQNLLQKKHLAANIKELNENYDTNFTNLPFWGLLLKTSQAALHAEDSLFGEKICDVIKEVFSEEPHSVYYDENGIRLIVQSDNSHKIPKKINMLFFKVKNLTAIYGKFDLNIGCGSMVKEVDEIAVSCEEAQIAYKAHLTKYSDTILVYDKLNFSNFDKNIYDDRIFWKRVSIALETFHTSDMTSLMKEFERKLLEVQNAAPAYMERQCYELLSLVTNTFKLKEPKTWIQINIKKFDYCRNYSEVCHMITKEILAIMTIVETEKRQQYNKPIRDIQRYIHLNYDKQLSLHDLSVVVDLNPVYLSKLFKQQTGQGIVDYITDVRIEEAKTLLVETNNTIMAIAEEVGFLDDKYFSKQFKKVLGISPSEYRKLHM